MEERVESALEVIVESALVVTVESAPEALAESALVVTTEWKVSAQVVSPASPEERWEYEAEKVDIREEIQGINQNVNGFSQDEDDISF
ncbi:hypothetical protein AVEN_27294-1 [Araneus ventricosus]|uniref:Uncharacterized protein n=1 Tax=Araneus ventricosus TaxID=182803 RepID=A0A4Y2W2D1_ARAVE|nr:hypothetical protein AVEN_27294-1 [Araneus ventricosus]